jgi:uncharacterized repeat protein (TIGR01451 family)
MLPRFRRLLLAVVGLVAVPAAAWAQAGPPLEVVQTLAESLTPGVVVPAEILIRNVSLFPLDGVQVLDQVPAGYVVCEATPAAERSPDGLRWSLGRLGPGEERRLRLTLQPRGDPAARAVRNVVDVTYAGHVSSVRTARVAGPDLVLEVRAPEGAGVGSPVNLWLTVRNRGEAAARNVSLQTVLPPGLSHPQGPDLESPLGTLAPGAERTLPLPVTPTRPGTFRARVSAQAEGGGPVVREVAVVVEDLRIAVSTAGPASLPQQLTGLFEVTVRNDGGTACPVTVLVQLPEGMDFVGAGSGGVYDRPTHSIRWDVGELPPAARRVLAWNGLPRTTGPMTGRVRAACRDRVLQESSWAVRVVPQGAGSAD